METVDSNLLMPSTYLFIYFHSGFLKIKVLVFYLFIFIYFLGHATWHVGSLFPNWRSTPMLPALGHRVLITGFPGKSLVYFSFIYLFNFSFICFLLYNIVLVLPYIDMNPPWVYMCSPSWTPLPVFLFLIVVKKQQHIT